MIIPEEQKTGDEARRYREAMGLQINRKINTILEGWRRCGHEICRRAQFCCGTPLQCVIKKRQRPPLTPEQEAQSIGEFRKMLDKRRAELRAQNPVDEKVPPWKRPGGGIMSPEEFAEWAREIREEQRAGRAPRG